MNEVLRWMSGGKKKNTQKTYKIRICVKMTVYTQVNTDKYEGRVREQGGRRVSAYTRQCPGVLFSHGGH